MKHQYFKAMFAAVLLGGITVLGGCSQILKTMGMSGCSLRYLWLILYLLPVAAGTMARTLGAVPLSMLAGA